MANSKATNSKRKLSSIEEVSRKATGRKMDSIYVGAEMGLGALKIGSRKDDDTKINIVGYNVQGYITRIKRLKHLLYPTSSQNYTAAMPALTTIAYNGFKTMSDTLSAIQSCKSQILAVIHSDDTFLLPPALKLSKTTTSKASESSGSL